MRLLDNARGNRAGRQRPRCYDTLGVRRAYGDDSLTGNEHRYARIKWIKKMDTKELLQRSVSEWRLTMSNRLRELIAARDAAPSGVLTPALILRDWMENHAEAVADLWDAAEKYLSSATARDNFVFASLSSAAKFSDHKQEFDAAMDANVNASLCRTALVEALVKLKEQP
jgi:hypothetical protein